MDETPIEPDDAGEEERAEQESTWRNFASVYAEGFDSWQRTIEGAKPENKLPVFEMACREAVSYVNNPKNPLAQPDAIDALAEIAQLNDITDETFREIIGRVFPPKT